jgi:acetoacetyl-CoA synthetase
MHAFMQHVALRVPEVRDYSSLHRWSVAHYQDFWRQWLERSGVVFGGSASPVLTHERMPSPGFFPRVQLSFAENLLRHHGDGRALASFSEAREPVRLSHDALSAEVARVRGAFEAWGIRPGDRVAGFVPNIAEAVVAMLAAASLGAVWSSCSPDFGVQGAVDRFGQIGPRILVTANGYVYHGKRFDCLEKCAQIAAALPSVEHVVVIPLLADHADSVPGLDGKSTPWDALPYDGAPLSFLRQPFDAPLYILYSSGTTGIPKCIVHGAGGTLLQHAKEHLLHCDLRPGDNLVYFTTCGWMMWNWLVSALFTGCTVTLFDGSPTHPAATRMWELVATEGITHFGTSAKFLAGCRDKMRPRELGLDHLRVIMSTGSPLLPEDFDWVYRDVATDVQLSSISGGTDIISCFVLGAPTLPVYRGEIQCLGLGMDVVALDEHNTPRVGEKGELVCRKPFPSMPVGFLDDPDGEKYRRAYFDRIAGVWCHGDFIAITGSQGSAGGVVVYGRSDATLKPGGVRIGTAEIYRLVETLPEVEDSIVIGQPWEGDVRVVLFVKPAAGVRFDADLASRIKAAIRAGATPRHVPALVLPVDKIPYTRSGKKMELAVLEIICGREPKNKEAMQDASALAAFRPYAVAPP